MENLIKRYPSNIQTLSQQVRLLILSALPEATEEIDTSSNLIGFSIAPGMKGTVFTLLPAINHVTIGFYKGAELADPAKLLIGAGKVHRHVKVSNSEQLKAQPFIDLLNEAVQAARLRVKSSEEL